MHRFAPTFMSAGKILCVIRQFSEQSLRNNTVRLREGENDLSPLVLVGNGVRHFNDSLNLFDRSFHVKNQ